MLCKHSKRPLGFLLLLALATAALPAFGQLFVEPKASVSLVSDRASYSSGGGVRLAAVVDVEENWHVNSNVPTYEFLRPTLLELSLPEEFPEPVLTYPPDHPLLTEGFDDPIAVYDGRFPIFADFELPERTAAGELALEATLHYQACDDKQCLPPTTASASLKLQVGTEGASLHADIFNPGAGPAVAASSPATNVPAAAPQSLPWLLLLALLGGLILNAMPCVLPVLSLKIFGLVKSAGQGRSHLVAGCLATFAGILFSFWLLAAAAIVARGAGAAVGWGIQFQQPAFVAFLALVVVLFSLNMWGLFEIPLPQSLARAAGSGQREGLAGHFASGLFATLMATPCSAPFLGTAVGFALAQSAFTIFAIFTAIGVGLALPYLLLAAVPAAASWLPKPGAWMATLRGVMGFFLAAAAVWLFYVLAAQISVESLAFFQLALLVLALCIWLQHHASGASKKLAVLGAFAAAGLSLVLVTSAQPASSSADTPSRLGWLTFDEQEAQKQAAEGRLVFVDVTADWCLTCKVNERVVLETDEIAAAFERYQVIPMKADWTNHDDHIATYLAQFGRSSIPFYALYRPGREPHVFGELLTKGRVVKALEDSLAER